jgi:beta-fructofuranosidase
MGDFWYLLTTEYSDKSKTVYRMSRSLQGPWSAPIDDAFDGRAYYAARSASDGEHRYLFGWVATKEGGKDSAAWQWGGTLVVHEVYQRADGSLGTRIPAAVAASFDVTESLVADPIRVEAGDGRAERVVGNSERNAFVWESTLRVDEGTRSFALLLGADEATGDAYEFLFEVGENRLRFDKVPNYPWNRYDSKGLERPLHVAPSADLTIQVVVDDTIATAYVNGVALNARMYDRRGGALGVQVIDGGVTVLSSVLRSR